MLGSLSDDRNINSGPDELALEDKESHETESDTEEPFEIRHVLEELPRKEKFRDQPDQSVGNY